MKPLVMELLPLIGVFAAALVAYASVAAAESAVVAADKTRLRESAERGDRGAAALIHVLERPERLFGATIASLAFAAAAAVIAAALVGRELVGPIGYLLGFVAVPAVLLFAHGAARAAARRFADALATRVTFVLRAAMGLWRPLLAAVDGASVALDRALGAPADERVLFEAREKLRAALLLQSEESSDTLEPQQLIHRIVAFHDTIACEAMVPLFHVAAIPDTATVGEALSIARDTGHSRLPVYQGRVDNITGVVICFDLVGLPPQEPITPHLREARYEPETKPLKDLLVTFKREHWSLVVLVDEYGGAVGIASLEDLIEEIVGEIEDEYDPREPRIEPLGPRRFRISGRVEIDTLNEHFDWELPEGEYETLAGFLLVLLQRIPAAGETATYRGLHFRVLEATRRAIQWVEVVEAEEETP